MSSNAGLGNDGIFSLTYHPTQQDVILAGTYNGIVKTTDGGKSWVSKNEGMPEEQWPFAVVIDHTDPNTMYAVTKNGENKGYCDQNDFCGVVMKSTDGGESWSQIMTGLDDKSEFYGLIIHPENKNILFLSSSKMVYGSDDAGQSWIPINNDLPTEENWMRDNVAQNFKLSIDNNCLILGTRCCGAWRANISEVN